MYSFNIFIYYYLLPVLFTSITLLCISLATAPFFYFSSSEISEMGKPEGIYPFSPLIIFIFRHVFLHELPSKPQISSLLKSCSDLLVIFSPTFGSHLATVLIPSSAHCN